MKRSRSTPDGTTTGNQPKPIQLLLHASGGIVPYLTPTLLTKYFPAPQSHLLLGISVQDTCLAPHFPSPDAVQPRGYEFVSKPPLDYLKSYTTVVVPSFDLLHDANKRGQNSVQATGTGVSVWSLQGRQVLSNQAYMRLVLSATTTTTTTGSSPWQEAESSTTSIQSQLQSQPQFSLIVSLYDQAAMHQSKQRHEQARHRRQTWLQELIQDTHGSSRTTTTATTSPVWAVVSASSKNNANTNNNILVDDELEQLLENDKVSGYAIVGCSSLETFATGIHGGGGGSNIIIPQLKRAESSKTVAVLSVSTMQDVLECLEQGVSIIGTDLPTKWALSHQAFVLPLDYSSRKKLKENYDTNTNGGSSFLMDLTDSKYAIDSSPLLEGCGCMACGQDFYSRAYIHHLYQAKELLAQILLMGHNLHHMLEFCWVATQAQQEEQKQQQLHRQDDDQQPPAFDTFLQRCKRECGR